MALTRDEVAGIADYARIALAPDELDEMCAYMNEALELLEPVRGFDLDGVEPTFHPNGPAPDVLSADEPDDGRALGLDEALANAASTSGRFFRVPAILGEEQGR